jgi:hypothetical protein
MSRSFSTNCRSRDNLNWRIRCGCSPWARQIRCTELTLIPMALAIIAAVQWVTSPWRIAQRLRHRLRAPQP